MNRKHTTKVAIAIVLCLAMVLPFLPLKAEAAVNFDALGDDFKGVTLSILGDSISTYYEYSNNADANSTTGKNLVYYNQNNTNYQFLESVDDTWWMQAINALDMELLVNNSCSGSYALQDGCGRSAVANQCTAAWKDRCMQLHNDTTSEEPDIVAVYLGTNDIKAINLGFDTMTTKGYTTLTGSDGTGTPNATMISQAAGTGTTTNFSPVLGAYMRMVHNILETYENSEVYLFTLLPNWNQTEFNVEAMEDYNRNIRQIVTYYQENGYANRLYLVDLHKDSGITSDLDVMDQYFANCLHPNALGMDAITNCFLSSLAKNSKYSTTATWKNVSYDLNDVYVEGGKVSTAANGEAFSVSLFPTRKAYSMDVTVTMGGEDVTATAYAGGRVYIEEVTGDIEVTAKAIYNTHNYRWEWKDGVLASCTLDGNDYNVIGGIDENTTNTVVTDGYGSDGRWSYSTNKGTRFSLNNGIILRNEEPWVIEWKQTRYWGYGGALTSTGDTFTGQNNAYIYSGSNKGLDNTEGTGNDDNMVALGYYNNYGKWNVYLGVPTAKINGEAVYRLVNQVNADGSNMVYLYVNDELQGALNNYYYSNTQLATDSDGNAYTDNWVVGRDFVFPYLGANGKALAGVKLEYLQVWEGGDFDTLRLEQLIEESDEMLSDIKTLLVEQGTIVDTDGVLTDESGAAVNEDYAGTYETIRKYAAYLKAVNVAKAYVKDKTLSQGVYDRYASDILTARNALYVSDNQTNYLTRFLSVELLTGKAYAGKQVGVKVITDPDVKTLTLRDGDKAEQALTFCSGKLQYLTIGGEEQLVKVWTIGFNAPTVGTYSWYLQPDNYNTTESYWSALDFTVI